MKINAALPKGARHPAASAAPCSQAGWELGSAAPAGRQIGRFGRALAGLVCTHLPKAAAVQVEQSNRMRDWLVSTDRIPHLGQ